MVLRSLWGALQNITGIAGISPLDLGYGIAAIIALLILVALVQSIRGKTAFSIEPKDSEWSV